MDKLLLIATTAFLIAGPALAEAPRDERPTQAVSVHGVDFQDHSQVKSLYAKLRGAAVAVCDSGSANPRISQMDAVCVDNAVRQAVKSVDQPSLTAFYRDTHDGQRAFARN